MQQLIATYLFTHNSCSLPGIGELKLHTRSAVYVQGDQEMNPPETEVRLMESNKSDENFIRYIAHNLNISNSDAVKKLNDFCKSMLSPGKETPIEAIGSIVVDDLERVSFVENYIPTFAVAVPAQRVVRQTPHSILVGETESNSEIMSAYYADQQDTKKTFWWVWAIAIFLIAATLITYYIISDGFNPAFGSKDGFDQPEIPATYQKAP